MVRPQIRTCSPHAPHIQVIHPISVTAPREWKRSESDDFVGMILYFITILYTPIPVASFSASHLFQCVLCMHEPNSAKPACRTRSLVTLGPPVFIFIPSTGLIPLAGGRRLKRDRPHVGVGHRTDPNCTHTYVVRRTLKATQLSHSGNKAPTYHAILAFPRSGAKGREKRKVLEGRITEPKYHGSEFN